MQEVSDAKVVITEKLLPGYETVLTPQALAFLGELHRAFQLTRVELLEERKVRQHRTNEGERPSFLPYTAAIRNDKSWRVAATPADLEKRWVEITGPTDKKMLINALNSGADIFMADFEDANAPTWKNMVEGQRNLVEAVNGTLAFTSPEGKDYTLNPDNSVLMVRPRGWHLVEKHLLVDGEPISASLFDFGLYFFHNARELLLQGSGPYFYLPKIESNVEARLWNDVFVFAQQYLGLPRGTIRATVLIETIFAAFEMEEILYQLREHSAGLNAGRWDYIFSTIKSFQNQADFIFPDRSQITMTVPFMRAYTELLVRTCHARGAHAIGGMAAFVPSRKDKAVNETALAKVREDKEREVADGFDGTWVAHPDLVEVAHEVFAKALGNKPNQRERLRDDVSVKPEALLDFNISGGSVTQEGLRKNISISLQYLDSWLSGTGAVAIYNLMEDAATAEISRAQLWQWVKHGKNLTPDQYRHLVDEEYGKLQTQYIERGAGMRKLLEARNLLDQLVLAEEFPEFLTVIAYDQL